MNNVGCSFLLLLILFFLCHQYLFFLVSADNDNVVVFNVLIKCKDRNGNLVIIMLLSI